MIAPMHKLFLGMSVRSRLFWLIALILIPLVLLQGWTIRDRLSERVEQELQASEELASGAQSALSRFLEAQWTLNEVIGKQVVEYDQSPETIRSLLSSRVEYTNPAREAWWVTPDGFVAFSPDREAEGLYLGDRDFIQRHLQGQKQTASNLVFSRTTGEPIIVLSSAIYQDGVLQGIISMSIDSTRLSDAISVARRNAASISVVDTQGTPISMSGSSTVDLTQNRPNILSNPASPSYKVLKTGQPARSSRYTSVYDGQERLGAAVPVPEIGWVVVASNRIADVLAPAWRSTVVNVYVLLGVLGVALIVGWSAARSLAESARSLNKAAMAYARERWSGQIGPSSADELAAAASVFNIMSDEVERTARELRTKTAELSLILEVTTDGFFACDSAWRFTHVNRSAERYLRRSRTELIGHTIWERYPKAEGSIFSQQYYTAVHDGVPVSFEGFFEPLGNWFEVRAYPFEGGLAVFFRDITSRKAAAAALQAEIAARELEHARLKTILTLLPVGVVIADATGRVVEANNAADEMWGNVQRVGDISEYRIYRGWWPNTRRALTPEEWPLARALTKGEHPLSEEINIEAFDGRHLTLLLSAVPLRDQSGEIVGGVLVNVDVTQQKRLEADLRRHAAALERQREILEQIATGAPLRQTLRKIEHLVEESLPGYQCTVLLPEEGEDLPPIYKVRSETPSAWSTVVQSTTGQPLYALCITWDAPTYQHERLPSMAETATHLARIAVESHERQVKAIERLERIASHLTEGILAVDPNGEIVWHNPAALRLLGLEAPLSEGQPQESDLPGGLFAALKESAVTGSQRVTVPIPRPKGRPEVIAMVIPVRTALGRFGALAVLQEMTEERKFQRLQESFVANVSHELRGPLTTISATLEAIADGIIPEESRGRYVKAILEEMARLRRLSYDVVDLTRLDSGLMRLQHGPVSLAAIFEHVRNSFSQRASQLGLSLLVEPTTVLGMGDGDRITQVVTNLVDNAFRFTPAGGTVRLRAQREGAMIRVEVTDSGIGIPAEHLDRVWDRFHKVDPARTLNPGTGSGLGLSIARQLVEQMGGQVQVHSTLSQGSTFSFTLLAAETSQGV